MKITRSSAQPKVSVCIPVYNPGNYLQPAVESVLAQDFDDFELIIVDDCSSQSPESLINDYKDQRLQFLSNSHRLGLAANWNRCIALARGAYIAIFHQDDVMLPGNLSKKIRMLDNNPSVGFVYSNILMIDSTQQVIGGHYIPQPISDSILPGWMVYKMMADTGNPISCPTVMVRRECYGRLGNFNEQFPFATDMDMWLRLARYYDAGFLSDPLVSQRVHKNQETARFNETGLDYIDIFRVLKNNFNRSLPSPYSAYSKIAYQTLSQNAYKMARWKLGQGQYKYGARYLSILILSRVYKYMARN